MPAQGGLSAAGQTSKDKSIYYEEKSAQLMRELKLPQTLDWSSSAVVDASLTGKPYALEDFVVAVEGRVNLSEVIGVMSTNRNNVALLTFKTPEILRKATASHELVIKGHQGYIYQANPTRVVWVTLSGVPPQVPNVAVADLFKSFGRVITTRNVSLTGRLAHIVTSTRKVLLEVKAGVAPEDIPYELQVKGVNTIVNIVGRQLKCLKCGLFGHKRKDCETPRCTNCRRFGHLVDDCTGTRTYASALDGQNFPPLQTQHLQSGQIPASETQSSTVAKDKVTVPTGPGTAVAQQSLSPPEVPPLKPKATTEVPVAARPTGVKVAPVVAVCTATGTSTSDLPKTTPRRRPSEPPTAGSIWDLPNVTPDATPPVNVPSSEEKQSPTWAERMDTEHPIDSSDLETEQPKAKRLATEIPHVLTDEGFADAVEELSRTVKMDVTSTTTRETGVP